MKNMTKEQIKSARPTESVLWLIDFCLNALYDDKDHDLSDDINSKLTFEEILGTLLKAKDELLYFYDETTESKNEST